MPTSAGMKDNVRIAKKANADVSPEAWQPVGAYRRIALQRLSDRSALEAGAAIDNAQFQPTHRGLVETSSDFAVGRVLVRKEDDTNYMILRVMEVGRRNAGTGARYMQLVLSEMPTKVALV